MLIYLNKFGYVNIKELYLYNGLAKKRSHVERFKLLTALSGYAF